MIPDGEEWHYPLLKNPSKLLRGLTSKHHDDFYYLNCLHSFTAGNNVNLMKNVKITSFLTIKHHLLFIQILNVS